MNNFPYTKLLTWFKRHTISQGSRPRQRHTGTGRPLLYWNSTTPGKRSDTVITVPVDVVSRPTTNYPGTERARPVIIADCNRDSGVYSRLTRPCFSSKHGLTTDGVALSRMGRSQPKDGTPGIEA